LNLFLFFTIIFDIARLRSYQLTPQLDLIATVFSPRFIVKVLLAVFEARGKAKLLLPEFATCPTEAKSGIYKNATFWWMNALFKKGYSNSLAIDDLFQLDKHLEANYLHRVLDAAWRKCQLPHQVSSLYVSANTYSSQ
jgi:hypothetical protein